MRRAAFGGRGRAERREHPVQTRPGQDRDDVTLWTRRRRCPTASRSGRSPRSSHRISDTCTDDVERIVALWCEIDALEPFAFVAVTRTRSVLPTSSESVLYVSLVASVIARQSAPGASQRSHWYANVICAAPFQVPLLAVSALPWITEPVIDGRVVATGAFAEVALITAVAPESRLFVPDEFVPVTQDPEPVTEVIRGQHEALALGGLVDVRARGAGRGTAHPLVPERHRGRCPSSHLCGRSGPCPRPASR